MPKRFLFLGIIFLWHSCFSQADLTQAHCFVQLTDTHLSSPQSESDLRAVLQAVRQLVPRPDFIVVTGDITDMGRLSEIEAFRSIMDSSGVPYHVLLGNHDCRWSGYSLQQMEQLYGRPSRFHFTWQDIHILGLNSALPLEAWGDIDYEQVQWLRQSIDRSAPLIVLSHHPPVYPWGIYISENPALFACLDSLHTVVYLMGHGHRPLHWQHNGITMQMAPAVSQSRAFLVVSIQEDSLFLQSRTADQPQPLQTWRLSLTSKDTSRVVIRALQRDGMLLRWQCFSSPELLYEDMRWQFRRNQSAWEDLSRPQQPLWTLIDSVSNWSPGLHVLSVRAQKDNNRYFQHSFSFKIEDDKARVLWRRELGGRIQAPLLVIKNRLFIADGQGRLLALNPFSGQEGWRRTLPGSIVKGLTHGADDLFVATNSGHVFRLRAKDGHTLWQTSLDDAVTATPRYDGGKLYVPTASGQLYALDAATGRIDWRFQAGAHIQQQPCAFKDKIFFGSWDRTFYALHRHTGELLWSRTFSGSAYFAPATAAPTAIDDRVIFIRAVPTAGMPTVYACHIDTGDTLWTGRMASHYCSPLALNDRIVFGALDGRLYALDPQHGSLIWQIPLGEELFDSRPIWHHGDIFIVTIKGSLWRVDAKSGKIKARYQVGDGLFFADMAVFRNIIFAAEVDGGVTALQLAD